LTTSDTSLDHLPVIKIVSEEEEMHVRMNLEMEDSTHGMLVKMGKEVATDEDFVQIAITHGLKEYIDQSESHE